MPNLGYTRGESIKKIQNILVDGRAMFLSYDHGMEHGPKDFSLQSVDPHFALNMALEGGYSGIILHAGVASKYYTGHYTEVPLIVKLNGKTNITSINPMAKQVCTVERALKIGASAVGYTIYDGSPNEPEMFQEFSRIVDTAHDYGLPVIVWMYPRGPNVSDELNDDLLAYSARIALELGADIVKLKYNHNQEAFKWIVKCAGRCKTVVSEPNVVDDVHLINTVYHAMRTGVTGFAFSRNLWNHPRPFSLSKALHDIIFKNKNPEQVKSYLNEGL
ncbi:fructose-bisphosphate aldolase [Candidatus Woesearchaeota archaeon]|nr:fructose-bisphosphate aldolase [Candidatus Woesearchaeota archaeon]